MIMIIVIFKVYLKFMCVKEHHVSVLVGLAHLNMAISPCGILTYL